MPIGADRVSAPSAPTGGPVLEVDALTKRFGKVTAVDAVSFSVARGATAALLGANGAGKTTTIAMILGLLLPSAQEQFLVAQRARDE